MDSQRFQSHVKHLATIAFQPFEQVDAQTSRAILKAVAKSVALVTSVKNPQMLVSLSQYETSGFRRQIANQVLEFHREFQRLEKNQDQAPKYDLFEDFFKRSSRLLDIVHMFLARTAFRFHAVGESNPFWSTEAQILVDMVVGSKSFDLNFNGVETPCAHLKNQSMLANACIMTFCSGWVSTNECRHYLIRGRETWLAAVLHDTTLIDLCEVPCHSLNRTHTSALEIRRIKWTLDFVFALLVPTTAAEKFFDFESDSAERSSKHYKSEIRPCLEGAIRRLDDGKNLKSDTKANKLLSAVLNELQGVAQHEVKGAALEFRSLLRARVVINNQVEHDDSLYEEAATLVHTACQHRKDMSLAQYQLTKDTRFADIESKTLNKLQVSDAAWHAFNVPSQCTLILEDRLIPERQNEFVSEEEQIPFKTKLSLMQRARTFLFALLYLRNHVDGYQTKFNWSVMGEFIKTHPFPLSTSQSVASLTRRQEKRSNVTQDALRAQWLD
ncbi:hypothetical protein OIO90_004583 [Microbotryomycetes sp. JL221]|nr:hypothetical protein OIO90_004583 [Microbotryomycetes sp. JL221]